MVRVNPTHGRLLSFRPPAKRRSAELTGDPRPVFVAGGSHLARRSLVEAMETAGLRTVTAADGLEALELLQRNAGGFSLLLLDAEMARMSGEELTSLLRAQGAYRDVPIAVLAANSSDGSRRQALAMGADAYLLKPFQEQDLLAMVHRLLAKARAS